MKLFNYLFIFLAVQFSVNACETGYWSKLLNNDKVILGTGLIISSFAWNKVLTSYVESKFIKEKKKSLKIMGIIDHKIDTKTDYHRFLYYNIPFSSFAHFISSMNRDFDLKDNFCSLPRSYVQYDGNSMAEMQANIASASQKKLFGDYKNHKNYYTYLGKKIVIDIGHNGFANERSDICVEVRNNNIDKDAEDIEIINLGSAMAAICGIWFIFHGSLEESGYKD